MSITTVEVQLLEGSYRQLSSGGSNRKNISSFKSDIENKFFPYLSSNLGINMEAKSYETLTSVAYDGFIGEELIALEFSSNDKNLDDLEPKSVWVKAYYDNGGEDVGPFNPKNEKDYSYICEVLMEVLHTLGYRTEDEIKSEEEKKKEEIYNINMKRKEMYKSQEPKPQDVENVEDSSDDAFIPQDAFSTVDKYFSLMDSKKELNSNVSITLGKASNIIYEVYYIKENTYLAQCSDLDVDGVKDKEGIIADLKAISEDGNPPIFITYRDEEGNIECLDQLKVV